MRTRLKLFLFSAVVSLFLVFLYNYGLTRPWIRLGMKLNDGKTQSNEKDRKEERYQLQQTIATRKNLIILSPGRGGSSFLGSLFDCNPRVMYFFEPLYAVSEKMFKVNLTLGD